MQKLKKIVAAVAALAALALGGAAIAGATGGGGDTSDRGDGDGELSAAVEKQAGQAALEVTGGGTLGQIERDGEKGATYEVEVKRRRRLAGGRPARRPVQQGRDRRRPGRRAARAQATEPTLTTHRGPGHEPGPPRSGAALRT